VAGLAFLQEKKHDETKRFVDFVHSLRPPPLRLPARIGAIETVRVRGFRSGFNIKFCDAEGTRGPAAPLVPAQEADLLEGRRALPGANGRRRFAAHARPEYPRF
jgi:hypothetical protein